MFHAMLPECVLAIGLLLTMVVDLLTPAPHRRRVLSFALLVCACALGAVGYAGHGPLGLVALDSLTTFVRITVLVGTALALGAVSGSAALMARRDLGEYAVVLLGLALGAMVLGAATNLLLIFLALELVSLSSYVLAGYAAGDRRAAEAGMKYVLFGGLATGLMLFGMSHLYGLTGSLELSAITFKLAGTLGGDPVFLGALVLSSAGLVYKLALAPFHYYAPEVYQGSPTISAGVFATLPKIAAFAVLARVVDGAGGHHGLSVALTGVAVLTMLTGSLGALAQRDGKRILAFSAIAHAGAMLLALAAWDQPAARGALLHYLAAYVTLNLGAFAALALLEGPTGTGLAQLAGAWRRRPLIAAALALCAVALIGLPPFAGFWAKWFLLLAVLGTGSGYLAVGAAVVLLSSVLSALAYLRLVRAVIIDEDATQVPTPARDDGPAALVVLMCALAALGWMAVLPLLG